MTHTIRRLPGTPILCCHCGEGSRKGLPPLVRASEEGRYRHADCPRLSRRR